MAYLTHSGFNMIFDNVKNEQPIIEFVIGLCHGQRNHKANKFGLICKNCMDLVWLEYKANTPQEKELYQSSRLSLIASMCSMPDYDKYKALILSVVSNPITDISQWLARLEDCQYGFFVNSVILQYLFAMIHHVENFEFFNPQNGKEYYFDSVLSNDSVLPEKDCSVSHLQTWTIGFLTLSECVLGKWKKVTTW